MASITQAKGGIGRRGGGLVRPDFGWRGRGIGIKRPSLGLLTPQTTMDRARALEYRWARLSDAVTHQQNQQRLQRQWKELQPERVGWVQYYLRLKSNAIARVSEYGELEEWERRFMALRTKFANEGLDVSAVPTLAVGSTPGKVVIPEQVEVQVDPGDTPEQIRQKAQEASEQFVADLGRLAGRIALYGAGVLLVGAGVLWAVNRSKKKPAMGRAGCKVPLLTPAQSRKRVAELRRKGCKVEQRRLPSGDVAVMKKCPKGVSGLGYTSEQHFEHGENAIDDLTQSIKTINWQLKKKGGCKTTSRRLQEASMDAERAGAHFWAAMYDPKATDSEKRAAENLLKALGDLNRELRWINQKFEYKCLE